MATLSNIVSHLNALLTPQNFNDSAFNGLQIESSHQEIKKVAVAVDAGLSILERAAAERCQLLIVHHGLFWGSQLTVSGIFGRKVETLLRAGCSLYGSHLPLDAHPEVGNNALLARHYDLEITGKFAEFGGPPIGITARARKPQPMEFFVQRSTELIGAASPLSLPFGPAQISTVGLVSGSGASAIWNAAAMKLDLLISGEPKQQAYHDAKELGVNAIFAGHYATETLGVRALGERLHETFGVEWMFIDEPTGI